MKNKNISIIGVGRLGLCLALCLEKSGYHVLGVDISQQYIQLINNKKLSSCEPFVEEYLKESSHFRATASLKEGIEFSDVCLITVPNNTLPHIATYDHEILSNILREINQQKVKNKHLVISSTVFPGYIRNKGLPLIKECSNTSISYKPEFIAQGNIIQGLRSPDMILIGEGSQEAGNILKEIYMNLCINSPPISRMSIESAEIAKLAINCFITGKIAFANLIGDIADESPGAEKNDVLEAIGRDQRIGSKNLKPGYGFGGPSFHLDNQALENYASFLGIDAALIKAAENSNLFHSEFMAKKFMQKNLNEYIFDDVCYKPNCPEPIIEHSPKLAVAEKVAYCGKKVTILDTENVIQKVQQQYGDVFKYVKQNLSP